MEQWKGKYQSLSQVPSFVTPRDCSLPGSSIHGILQARILEWGAIPLPRESSWPREWTLVSCIAGRLVTIWAAAAAAAAKSLQLCPTLCDPIDGSPSGSTVPGILQAPYELLLSHFSRVRLCVTP